MSTKTLRIERKTEVIRRTGLPATTLQDRITSGLFPRPVSLGGRAVGWPKHEVDAVISAMIAGQENTQIRILVLALTKSRKNNIMNDPKSSQGGVI